MILLNKRIKMKSKKIRETRGEQNDIHQLRIKSGIYYRSAGEDDGGRRQLQI